MPQLKWAMLTHIPLDKRPPFRRQHFQMHFFNERFCIMIRISLTFFFKGPIDNKAALVQVMAWRRTGDKHYLNQSWPNSLTHICGTRGRSVDNRIPWRCYDFKISLIPGKYLCVIYAKIIDCDKPWQKANCKHSHWRVLYRNCKCDALTNRSRPKYHYFLDSFI